VHKQIREALNELSQLLQAAQPAGEWNAALEAAEFNAPHPDHIEHIQFEGNDRVILSPESYKQLYMAAACDAEQAAEQKVQQAVLADLIVRDVCEMGQANPNLNNTICIDVSDLLAIVKRHTTALSAQSEPPIGKC
jgi:hypothetical protein